MGLGPSGAVFLQLGAEQRGTHRRTQKRASGEGGGGAAGHGRCRGNRGKAFGSGGHRRQCHVPLKSPVGTAHVAAPAPGSAWRARGSAARERGGPAAGGGGHGGFCRQSRCDFRQRSGV